MNDAESTLDILKDFLSAPDAKEKISQALDIINSSDFNFPNLSPGENSPPTGDPLSSLDYKKLINLVSSLKKYENTPDPRCNLLRALKPYLNPSKSNRADKAIKIASMLKYAPMLENLKDIF